MQKYNSRVEQGIANNLMRSIDINLSRVGLLFRVFARAKSQESIISKFERKSYGRGDDEKKMQDVYGVRIALYFPDDTELAQHSLKSLFVYDESSSTIDLPTEATFGPTRSNLIFRLPQEFCEQALLLDSDPRIDSTFEVQFRTMFSEGWHEVEHDLRYKCKDDWENHKDLYRAMNGLIATLETCDWAVIKLFEDLAWRHYKAKEWLPMMRTKFRLRWGSQKLEEDIIDLFNQDENISKSIFRIDRKILLGILLSKKIDLPITPSNLIYLSNHFFIHSDYLNQITPAPIVAELAGLNP